MAAKQSNSRSTLKEPLLRYLKKPGQSFYMSQFRALPSSSLRLMRDETVEEPFSDIEGICGINGNLRFRLYPNPFYGFAFLKKRSRGYPND